LAAAAVLVLLPAGVRADAPALGWEPARTWVFVVGILEWKDANTWAPFPEAREGRCDKQLVDFFKKSGVPAGQVAYLQDRQATLKNVREQFDAFAARPAAGDLLVFYFAGHGWWDSDKNLYYFANYDAHKEDSSDLWPVRSICDTVQRCFRGGRVLFLADCCHSGGLLVETRRRTWRCATACLTSAHSHSLSTGSWTFTECLLQALRGDPQLDLDGDGRVCLDELARHAEREMAFRHGQKSVFAAAAGFDPRMPLARATGKRDERLGRHVEVRGEDGKWYPAFVGRLTDDGPEVTYLGSEETEVVAKENRIRPYRPAALPRGTPVKVKWTDGEKYDAVILQSFYGLYYVHYTDYGDEYDEWVSAEQVGR
jgi:hypothetical protein